MKPRVNDLSGGEIMLTLFFSYSHKDEPLRDALEVHLAALKRQKVIGTWHDRRISAGTNIDQEIDKNLEKADIILLLVSPDFIASDYCYDIEMKRALEKHQEGKARVIPVILEPCDWHGTDFGNLRATPKDGSPVSIFTNQNEAFYEVTKDIRKAASGLIATNPTLNKNPTAEAPVVVSFTSTSIRSPRSSNLRVKKDFSDIERSRFLRQCIDYIATFFQNSLSELTERASNVESEFTRIDANKFNAGIYRSGNLLCQCKIWLATDRLAMGDIGYSSNWSSGDNTWNDALSIGDDGYVLGLKPSGFSFYGNEKDKLLTMEGAAEYFWSKLIQPLQ